MDRQQLEDYILKLSQIEKELTDETTEDLVYIKELDKLLTKLRDDISTSQSKDTYDFDYSVKVKIKRLKDNAITPTYAKDGDAGMDLTATDIISDITNQITYGTGIALEIPTGYVGLVFPRSSIKKYELQLSNSVGVIDSGYRGEIQVTFNKIHNCLTDYKVGDRVAQIVILPYPKIKFVESDELSNTERGVGGFGSTGL